MSSVTNVKCHKCQVSQVLQVSSDKCQVSHFSRLDDVKCQEDDDDDDNDDDNDDNDNDNYNFYWLLICNPKVELYNMQGVTGGTELDKWVTFVDEMKTF